MTRYFSGLTLVAALMLSVAGCAPAEPVIETSPEPYGDTSSGSGSNTTNAAETPIASETPTEPAAEEAAPAEEAAAPAEEAAAPAEEAAATE